MLHLLDDMDAKMNEMEGVMRRTPTGAFSEKIWSLDRRLYHPRTRTAEPETAAGAGPSAPDGRSTYDGLL